MAYEKIVVVTRKTRLEGLVERFNTPAQAAFIVERAGGDFKRYRREHEAYDGALEELHRQLSRLTRVHVIQREFLPNYIFTPQDLVVAIGIDGQVVNTAKYLDGQPLIAVNPDPEHIDGILLPFTVENVGAVVARALAGHMRVQEITMAEARLNDGQSLLAFNDFFIGRHDHVSARYRIQANGRAEDHSSSGIIVSTGVGATGWFSSFFNMANGLFDEFLGPVSPDVTRPKVPWDANYLYFVVREPFVSKTSAAGIVSGTITPQSPLLLESHMPDSGVIFSDGIASDFIQFNSGAAATVTLAERRTRFVVG
jgi:hypothetical protein